jgi:hypothetical protein
LLHSLLFIFRHVSCGLFHDLVVLHDHGTSA